MKLVLLGTTGYHPSATRQTACLMLPESGVLLDAGTGMFRAREHLQTAHLDIFLSHAHLDHVVGLTYHYDVLAGREMERVTVHGVADKLAAVREHLFSPLMFPVEFPWELRPLAGPVALADGGRVTSFPLEHPGGSTGYRIDWPGKSLAYVTDTTAREDAEYVAEIRGVDLLVHECYFEDSQQQWAEQTGHSCATAVARVARAAGVGRLLLVHTNPLDERPDPVGLPEMRKIFPWTELGDDEMVVEW
jgi:ribonuclease BN (tRNA processing enzyme)